MRVITCRRRVPTSGRRDLHADGERRREARNIEFAGIITRPSGRRRPLRYTILLRASPVRTSLYARRAHAFDPWGLRARRIGNWHRDVATDGVRKARWVSVARSALTDCQRVQRERPRESKGWTAAGSVRSRRRAPDAPLWGAEVSHFDAGEECDERSGMRCRSAACPDGPTIGEYWPRGRGGHGNAGYSRCIEH